MTFDEYWTAEMKAVGSTNYRRESLFYALAERAWNAAWRRAKKSEQAAWHAGLDAGREQGKAQQPAAADEVHELFLCESSRLYLHPGRLYRFTVDPKCAMCAEAASHCNHAAQPGGSDNDR